MASVGEEQERELASVGEEQERELASVGEEQERELASDGGKQKIECLCKKDSTHNNCSEVEIWMLTSCSRHLQSCLLWDLFSISTEGEKF